MLAILVSVMVPVSMTLSQYIADGWVSGPSCQTDTGEIFTPDGRYLTLEEEGSWKSNGNEIVIMVGDRVGRYRIKPINRNYALFRDQNGQEWYAKRCPMEG